MDFVFNQAETIMVDSAVVFFTTVVAGDGAAHRADAEDDGEAGRAGVGMFPLHFPALQREGMVGCFPGYPEFRAGGLPFDSMRFNPFPPASLVSEEVCELVFKGAPNFLFGEIFELRVQLYGAGRPPGAASSGAHPWIPGNADFPSEFRHSEGVGGILAPSGHAGIRQAGCGVANWLASGRGHFPQPRGETKLQLGRAFRHP